MVRQVRLAVDIPTAEEAARVLNVRDRPGLKRCHPPTSTYTYYLFG